MSDKIPEAGTPADEPLRPDFSAILAGLAQGAPPKFELDGATADNVAKLVQVARKERCDVYLDTHLGLKIAPQPDPRPASPNPLRLLVAIKPLLVSLINGLPEAGELPPIPEARTN